MKKIYILLSVLLFIACYDDKGNYDYNTINEVSVNIDAVYGVRLADTTFEIRPEVLQTSKQNKDNLKYTWLHSTINENFYGHGKMDTVSREDYALLHINPDDKDLEYVHYFRFNVYDEITGIEYPYNTIVKIIKPYSGAWMILHEQDGNTKLGAVEYIGDRMEVCDDAYFRETGKHLRGKPVSLGVHCNRTRYYDDYTNIFFLATDVPEEAGVYCQWKKFQKMDSLSRMVAPSYRGSFDYSNVRDFDGGGSYGAVCLAGKDLYQIPVGMKFYKAPIDPTITGDVKISHGTKAGFVSMFYDEAGKRFLFYNGIRGYGETEWNPAVFSEEKDNNSKYRLALIPDRDLNVKTTDPNNLSADKEVLYLGSGYNYDATMNNQIMCYGVARSLEKDSCYVYEFRSYGLGNSSQAAFSGFYQISIPEELTDESCFASSVSYNGIIYYTAGNKVYRLDFMQQGGKATAIYIHTGGVAKVMKFACRGVVSNYLDYSEYEHDPNRSLGVVFEMPDGTSELVILNLATTGKVDSDGETWPPVQVHKGFGNVKDIVFL